MVIGGTITDGGATGQGVCLEVRTNDALLSLDGLGALASCAKGGVSITNNAQLTDISALAKVGALGKDGRGISLELSHLPQLASAGAAFGMLTELPGALHMANNARMSTPGQLLERLASVGAAKDGSSLRLDQLMPVLRAAHAAGARVTRSLRLCPSA